MKTTYYICLFLLGCLCFPGFAQAQTIHISPGFSSGTGFDGVTFCVLKQPDDKLLIGGEYNHYNGTATNGLCRINPNGSIDSSFHFNDWTGTDDYPSVLSLAMQADGKIVVGGSFTVWDGYPRSGIVRLHSDGTVDTTFNPGTGFVSNYYGIVWPYALEIQDDGKTLVLGSFSDYNGTARNSIARLNSDGTLDTAYDPGVNLVPINGAGPVRLFSSALQPDGKLITVGLISEFNGIPLDGLVRLNADGTLDAGFTAAFDLEMNPDLNIGGPLLQAVELQADGKVLVGGKFTGINGEPHVSIVRLLGSGAIDDTFNPSPDFSWAPSAGPGQVNVFDIQDDGKIVVGGAFDHYDGLPQTNLIRLFPDGSTDYGFGLNEMFDNNDVPRIVGAVNLTNSNLLIVGIFSSVQNDPVNRVALLDVCGSFSVTDVTTCEEYLWDANSTTYPASGNYFAQLPNANGCDSILVLQLTIPVALDAPEICIVGLDSLTNENRIVWEKPLSLSIDSFYVYRETNVSDVYDLIGATDYDAVGVFVDVDSDPSVQAYRYKIGALDTCGRETELSTVPHKTIHLTINQGIGTTWNLIWTSYEGITVPTYNIYRGTSTGNMTLLTSVSGGMTTYSDLNAPDSVYYQVEFMNPNDCDPSKAINYNTSRSNISSNNPLALATAQLPAFNLFPNPAESQLTVELPVAAGTITIYSAIGAVVTTQKISNQQEILSIGHLAPGVYTMTVDSGNGTITQRFVKR